jgi:hypothetical protein
MVFTFTIICKYGYLFVLFNHKRIYSESTDETNQESDLRQLTQVYNLENGRAFTLEPRERVISPGCTTYPAVALSAKSF